MTAEQRTRIDNLLYMVHKITDDDARIRDILLYLGELKYATKLVEEVLE